MTRTPPRPLPGDGSLTEISARHASGELSSAQAIQSIEPRQLDRALNLTARVSDLEALFHGTGVSPGVASGSIAFSAEAAVAAQADGFDAILVLRESRPEDLPGLLASTAVVTERGGQATHAAVVARALGRPAVAGLVDGVIVSDAKQLRGQRGDALEAGEIATVDGSTGTVYRGRPPVADGGRS